MSLNLNQFIWYLKRILSDIGLGRIFVAVCTLFSRFDIIISIYINVIARMMADLQERSGAWRIKAEPKCVVVTAGTILISRHRRVPEKSGCQCLRCRG